MTLDEARQAIRDRSAPFARHVEAAAVIADSKKSELSDLIRCLHLSGLPAETAATALYIRTGRPCPVDPAQFVVDAADWGRYLATQLQLASS